MRQVATSQALRYVRFVEVVRVRGLSLLRQRRRRRRRRDGQLVLLNDAWCSFDVARDCTVDRRALGHGTAWLSPHRAVPGLMVEHGDTTKHGTAGRRATSCRASPCHASPCSCPCRAGRPVWKSILGIND